MVSARAPARWSSGGHSAWRSGWHASSLNGRGTSSRTLRVAACPSADPNPVDACTRRIVSSAALISLAVNPTGPTVTDRSRPLCAIAQGVSSAASARAGAAGSGVAAARRNATCGQSVLNSTRT